MRFYSRAFLFSFVPFALLLALSFLLVQGYVQKAVRDGLRSSLRLSQRNVEQTRDVNRIHNSRSLQSAGRNFALAQAMVSASAPVADAAAAAPAEAVDPLQTSLQEELLKLGVHGGHDIVIATRTDGQPLAGAVREGGGSSELVPMYAYPEADRGGLLTFRGEPYQTNSGPLSYNGLQIGYLTVGQRLNVSMFATSTVLLHGSRALYSTLEHTSLLDTGAALKHCTGSGECDVQLKGEHWMSLPILKDTAPGGWVMYSLVDVDRATAPVQTAIRRIFLCVALLALVTTLVCSSLSSRAIVQPVTAMVDHLRNSAKTGILPEFEGRLPAVLEVQELARTYNLAASSAREARESLQHAYIEFVYSLANALDARDRYTAGHSRRVSDLCCAIAAVMGQEAKDIERLRIGALLHDIGKLGVSDSLLQKASRLSEEEFKQIKQHPIMGRRILQGVQGFAQYLPAVELHHENWDGTGYPRRLCGAETPLDARIIHVADAYDAMTTDRAYRNGMLRERALEIIVECSGTQFDPEVVSALLTVVSALRDAAPPESRTPEMPLREPGLPALANNIEKTMVA